MSVTAPVLVLMIVAAAACTSPEAGRVRGGGPGADPGNRSASVELHEGADPYYQTPHLLATPGTSGSPRAAR
jgi:hypothetical protein